MKTISYDKRLVQLRLKHLICFIDHNLGAVSTSACWLLFRGLHGDNRWAAYKRLIVIEWFNFRCWFTGVWHPFYWIKVRGLTHDQYEEKILND